MDIQLLELVDIFLNGPKDLEIQEAWLGTVLSVGGSIVSGIIGSGKAKDRERNARKEKQRLERKMASYKRQPIIDPYAGYTNLSDLGTDLSGNITNPYANLSVATKAAEIQIEQADISLANTLDSLRATGASAGGATALAQAALASKKGVAASIEQQEVNNQKLKAQGEQAMQTAQTAEKVRMQNLNIDEANKVQEARALGAKFEFEQQEERDMTELDRMQAQIDGQSAREVQASADSDKIMANMMGNVVTGIGQGIAGGVFSGKSKSKSGGTVEPKSGGAAKTTGGGAAKTTGGSTSGNTSSSAGSSTSSSTSSSTTKTKKV